ncbi:putative non-structural maintenance of chromosome element 4, Nse4/EID family [Rosa chinensis]|uniref:Non-structural maintenance of chromosomes element 4 n=1 Tax=Rosa chinensis TaxID=74649 RepID=A0A2P6QMT4_ROSCH|nr:non-structural maintenance of chromosomes element 4 homolog A [Rosa chinensis]PRQ35478.1 putative non-structural maintenance of chromosome element 4, Nse4/EID family [Rosa chinensis]
MPRTAKRERSAGQGRGVDDGEEAERLRAVKRERLNSEQVENESTDQDAGQRRALRSDYNEILNLISEKRNELLKPESEKFGVIIGRVEKLHELVQKPREQVADAEALLDITNTLVTSVKSQSSAGITPSDFITCLIRDFGQLRDGHASIRWKDVGVAVAPIFKRAHGCCTMLGPMNTEYKERKAAVRTRRIKPTTTDEPEEIDAQEEEKTDTDRNMSTMFEILRKKKCVRLECLILNRMFFAQTVENLFALSFLVKDGRAEIIVDANRAHFVAPRNAAKATEVASREVVYRHFVFRFDFKDWKLMKDMVPGGEELMPHRIPASSEPASQEEPAAYVSQTGHTTPIRKLSRNRGRMVQEEAIVEESPEYDNDRAAGGALRRSKRKL